MRILFGAQGGVLKVFHELDIRLRDRGVIESSAYLISQSEFYFTQRDKLELFRENKAECIFQWDFTIDAGKHGWDPKELEYFEDKYGDPYLWNAVLADRRLTHGPLCKARQSYGSRFSHDQLREILYRGVKAIDDLFERFRPDCVINHVPATFSSYLLYLVAKGRSVPYLNLKSTKIENYFTLSESIHEKPRHIYDRYYKNLEQVTGYEKESEAEAYLKKASSSPVQYEGSSVRKRRDIAQDLKKALIGFALASRGSYRKMTNPLVAKDNHIPPVWGTYLYGTLLKGLRESLSRKMMARRAFDLASNEKFVFYPMNSEPEITLSVYGREHQNQIETVRRLAQSIPVGWNLVVKEHPRTIAHRSRGYYRKLLEIPNVYFADPDTASFHLIGKAQAVAVVSGFAGFEAAVIGKPVIMLGRVFYDVLPNSMVKKIESLSDFAEVLRDSLKYYRKDEDALRAFVAACMSESVNMNLYSDLFGKRGRVRTESDTADNQISRFTKYAARRIADVCGGKVRGEKEQDRTVRVY